jgi:hypothetical protein
LCGPDGEPWLPEDPFHSYDGPSAFGPGADWGRELTVVQLPDTDDHSSVGSLGTDAEFTLLSPGLLESLPH